MSITLCYIDWYFDLCRTDINALFTVLLGLTMEGCIYFVALYI